MSNIDELQAKLIAKDKAIVAMLCTVDDLQAKLDAAQQRITQLEQVLREHGICPQCGKETNGMPFHTCNAPAQKEGK